MAVKVKICGITNLDDALDAVELGADYLGFNFYPDSPRYMKVVEVKRILQEIPQIVKNVGVFVNCDTALVSDIAVELGLNLVQFHGDETPKYCNQFGRPYMRAIRPESEKDLKGLEAFEADCFLVDAFVHRSYGGTGVVSNWDLARKVKELGKPVFLSGGLTPENIEMAIQSVKPHGVDVTSGVEWEPGKKDYRKMEEFIKKVKAAEV